MVSEHLCRRFSKGLLGYLFGLKFCAMYVVAVLAGLASELAVDASELTGGVILTS